MAITSIKEIHNRLRATKQNSAVGPADQSIDQACADDPRPDDMQSVEAEPVKAEPAAPTANGTDSIRPSGGPSWRPRKRRYIILA